MSLRKQTLLAIGVTLVGLFAVLYFSARGILLGSFAELELRKTREQVARALGGLSDRLAVLNSKASDWADWDDTYAFMQSRDHRFIASNLANSAFTGLHLNLILFLSPSGEMALGRAFDLAKGKAVPLPPGLRTHLSGPRSLAARTGKEGIVTGVLLLQEGPMLIASRPILTSARTGPARGTLVMGRYLDSSEVAALSKSLHLDLAVVRFGDRELPADFGAARSGLSQGEPVWVRPVDEDAVAGYGIFRDLYGTPGLIVRVKAPREIYRQGRATIRYIIWSLLVICTVFSAVILIRLEKLVLSRLSDLSSQVRRIGASGDLSERVALPGGDELAAVGTSINATLQALEDSRRERRQAEEALRHARDELGVRVRKRTAELADANAVLQAQIAERRSAEEELLKLRKAVDTSGEVIFLTDREGTITLVNPAFTGLYGYSAEEVIGKATPRLLRSGRTSTEDYQSLWGAVLAGQSHQCEMINKTRGGELVTVEGSATPIVDEQGNVTGFLAIQRDVTQRKLLEEQFRQAQKMEAIGRLAGGIAHDFNNLLMAITGFCDLARDGRQPGEPLTGYLDGIAAAAERAASLTRHLLAFSRRQVLEPKVIALNDIVAEMEPILGRLIGEDVELRTNLDPSLGRVRADPGQIQQVVMNLVVNARDAMPRGGRLVVQTADADFDEAGVRHRTGLAAGRYVMLAVSDTGCGMDTETKARIFEPFFTTKEQGRGTGLGLSTVYGIVTQSGGDIHVYSEPGEGTEFRIYLPRVDAAAESLSVGDRRRDEQQGWETVLVAEDEDSVRRLIVTALERSGYRVLAACRGDEALAAAHAHSDPIHLLLTDVVMPGMGGPDLARSLLPLHPETRVIFMSGYTEDAMLRQGALGPGAAFLAKPFRSHALVSKVREVLSGPGTASAGHGAPPTPATLSSPSSALRDGAMASPLGSWRIL